MIYPVPHSPKASSAKPPEATTWYGTKATDVSPWYGVYTFAVALIGSLMLLLVTGARAAEVGLAAKVNGAGITQAQLQRSLDGYLRQKGAAIQAMRSPDRYKALQRRVLDVLIGQELLWQEAKKKNFITPTEEVDRALSQIRNSYPSKEAFLAKLNEGGFTEESYADDVKRQLSVRLLIQRDIAKEISVSEQEVHDYYAANPATFTRPEAIHLRHILIKAAPTADQAAKETAKKKIGDILTEATNGADFAELAKKHSEDPTGPKGGDLGFVSRGQLVEPFEKAAFALEPGKISGVIQTQFGYHIIKMEALRGRDLVPEKEVEAQIRRYLFSAKAQRAVEDKVRSLRAQGVIEILLPS